jgi:hypothetical protein
MAKKESKFQTQLIKEIETLFPGCVVIKNDASYIQGFPDLTVLYRRNWAVLEVKRSLKEPYRPNQQYYLEKLDDMSFGAMICPENKEAVLYELQRSFSSQRPTRISKPK